MGVLQSKTSFNESYFVVCTVCCVKIYESRAFFVLQPQIKDNPQDRVTLPYVVTNSYKLRHKTVTIVNTGTWSILEGLHLPRLNVTRHRSCLGIFPRILTLSVGRSDRVARWCAHAAQKCAHVMVPFFLRARSARRLRRRAKEKGDHNMGAAQKPLLQVQDSGLLM